MKLFFRKKLLLVIAIAVSSLAFHPTQSFAGPAEEAIERAVENISALLNSLEVSRKNGEDGATVSLEWDSSKLGISYVKSYLTSDLRIIADNISKASSIPTNFSRVLIRLCNALPTSDVIFSSEILERTAEIDWRWDANHKISSGYDNQVRLFLGTVIRASNTPPAHQPEEVFTNLIHELAEQLAKTIIASTPDVISARISPERIEEFSTRLLKHQPSMEIISLWVSSNISYGGEDVFSFEQFKAMVTIYRNIISDPTQLLTILKEGDSLKYLDGSPYFNNQIEKTLDALIRVSNLLTSSVPIGQYELVAAALIGGPDSTIRRKAIRVAITLAKNQNAATTGIILFILFPQPQVELVNTIIERLKKIAENYNPIKVEDRKPETQENKKDEREKAEEVRRALNQRAIELAAWITTPLSTDPAVSLPLGVYEDYYEELSNELFKLLNPDSSIRPKLDDAARNQVLTKLYNFIVAEPTETELTLANETNVSRMYASVAIFRKLDAMVQAAEQGQRSDRSTTVAIYGREEQALRSQALAVADVMMREAKLLGMGVSYGDQVTIENLNRYETAREGIAPVAPAANETSSSSTGWAQSLIDYLFLKPWKGLVQRYSNRYGFPTPVKPSNSGDSDSTPAAKSDSTLDSKANDKTRSGGGGIENFDGIVESNRYSREGGRRSALGIGLGGDAGLISGNPDPSDWGVNVGKSNPLRNWDTRRARFRPATVHIGGASSGGEPIGNDSSASQQPKLIEQAIGALSPRAQSVVSRFRSKIKSVAEGVDSYVSYPRITGQKRTMDGLLFNSQERAEFIELLELIKTEDGKKLLNSIILSDVRSIVHTKSFAVRVTHTDGNGNVTTLGSHFLDLSTKEANFVLRIDIDERPKAPPGFSPYNFIDVSMENSNHFELNSAGRIPVAISVPYGVFALRADLKHNNFIELDGKPVRFAGISFFKGNMLDLATNGNDVVAITSRGWVYVYNGTKGKFVKIVEANFDYFSRPPVEKQIYWMSNDGTVLIKAGEIFHVVDLITKATMPINEFYLNQVLSTRFGVYIRRPESVKSAASGDSRFDAKAEDGRIVRSEEPIRIPVDILKTADGYYYYWDRGNGWSDVRVFFGTPGNMQQLTINNITTDRDGGSKGFTFADGSYLYDRKYNMGPDKTAKLTKDGATTQLERVDISEGDIAPITSLMGEDYVKYMSFKDPPAMRSAGGGGEIGGAIGKDINLHQARKSTLGFSGDGGLISGNPDLATTWEAGNGRFGRQTDTNGRNFRHSVLAIHDSIRDPKTPSAQPAAGTTVETPVETPADPQSATARIIEGSGKVTPPPSDAVTAQAGNGPRTKERTDEVKGQVNKGAKPGAPGAKGKGVTAREGRSEGTPKGRK